MAPLPLWRRAECCIRYAISTLERRRPLDIQAPATVRPEGADARASYLDTANYGLPQGPTVEALLQAVGRWATGTSRIDDWIEDCDRARRAFAELTGTDASRIACSAATSQLVGLIASSLHPGDEVLVPEEEFTSNVFPWLAQEARGVKVRFAPTRELADAVRPDTSVVAFSLVQSLSGEVADLAKVQAAARRAGAVVVVDATQACGWLPFDAADIDFLVCSLYKWLGAPRGCALMAVAPGRLERVTPHAANWFAGASIYDALYGGPLRLAETARKLDLSPGWITWAGAAAALEHAAELDLRDVYAHDLALAGRFCAALGLPRPESPIVTIGSKVTADDLREQGVVAASRSGRLRFSFHLYNTEADVDRATGALKLLEEAG